MKTIAQMPITKVQILVVEDESIIAADISDCLENLGYSVVAVASSGETAVQLATTVHPDLVLMDIRLQGAMDGIQAAQQIWDRLRIPVIYASGYSDHSTMERAKETGPFGYVLKPIEERELYVVIETALQRHRLDREIESREQWLFSILRAIGDGVLVVDVYGRVRFINVIAEALTGWQRDEAIGQNINDIFHLVHEELQSGLPSPIDAVLQTGRIEYLADKTLLCSKTGQTIPVANSAAPFCDAEGTITGVVLLFRDMTERRQAEERNLAIARATQLEAQMAELQAINQLKDDFLNTVSHELRTPLTNIKMAIRMLEINLGQRGYITPVSNDDGNPTARYLNILSDQCNRQLHLVNDLLDLQRLNAEDYAIDLSTIYLQSWLPKLVEDFRERARIQQQDLQINLAPELPPIVTHASSFGRVLTELLNNALKYTPGNERIELTIQFLEGVPSSTVQMMQVQVSNSGVEIPATELTRIFDQFYRIPGADLWRQGGTGLGLTLVKKLINRLGGSIQVTSEQKQTCFIVELPVELSTLPMSPI
ncbi:MAG: response regulator [Leptolyngbya sp. BL-A-14]